MLYPYTLNEIQTNENPGVEYEIALFYVLCPKGHEKTQIMNAINQRGDKNKVLSIINRTTSKEILNLLGKRGLNLVDCSFETQNDNVGPADIVLNVEDKAGKPTKIGISIKYANTCTLNVTGKRFITDAQISNLRQKLVEYTDKYVQEMTLKHGVVENWFRKRKPSQATDEFIDLVRDAVIENWPRITDKEQLLEDLYQSGSPIEYWIFKYTNKSYEINDNPFHVSRELAERIEVRKMDTSYVAFYLDDKRIGHMQVKFNNGFVEKCKKQKPDLVVEGTRMSYGQPFSSWNFSIEQ